MLPVICGVLMLYITPAAAQLSFGPEELVAVIKTVKVSGIVMDGESGEPIPYATVAVENTGLGGVCDLDGKFMVEAPAGQKVTLLVRSVGYANQKLPLEDGKMSDVVIRLKRNLLDLDEVVVTGTRTEKPLKEAPVLTRIIPAAEIQRNDYESMMDVLEYNIPGLQFNVDPRGDNIRIQGLENKYILILVDGERLSITPGGTTDFERLSTSNIKQIEVIKGAASALYGSSAMGMVVNIITDSPKRNMEGWAKVRYSRFNEVFGDASIGFARKGFTSQTLFNWNSTDGYDLTPQSPNAFTKNPSHNWTVEEKLGWSDGKTRIWGTASFFWNEEKNPPKSYENTHYKSLNKTFRVNAERNLGKQNLLKLVYAGDFYVRDKVLEKTNSKEKSATSHIQTVRLTDIYTPLNGFQAVIGGEWNWNRDFNIMQFGEDKQTRRVNDVNGFLQLDWKIVKQLDLIGGFRYTHHSFFGDAYTPKVSVMYSPGRFKFRAGYSKGFKAPDMTELYSDFQMGSVSHNIGNPDLKPEYSDYYSFSVEYTYHTLNLSGEIYQNDIKDKIHSYNQIVKKPDGSEETLLLYDNVDDARIRGAEFTLTYFPVRQLLLKGAYVYTDAEDRNTGSQLVGNVRHAFNAGATLKGKIWKHEGSVSVSGRWNSPKFNQRAGTKVDETTGETVETIKETLQSAYSLWKLTAQYTPWEKKYMRLTLTAGVQNLFDYTDPVNFTTYDAGRRFFGSVIFRF